MSEDEESRITQVAMVQKCLDDTWPKEEDKKVALIYLMTAIRHYCEHEGLTFADITRQAAWLLRDEKKQGTRLDGYPKKPNHYSEV